MAVKIVQLFSGAESARVVDAQGLAAQDRRDQWPFVHCFPPPNALDVCVVGTVETQAQGAAAVVVVTYQVNAGKRFFLRGVVLGANVAIVPGQALFTVDRNAPVGVTNAQYMPEQGLTNVPCQLGSLLSASPWPMQRAREFAPLDVVRIKAVNVGLSAGDPYF